jgi:hypothetical protein
MLKQLLLGALSIVVCADLAHADAGKGSPAPSNRALTGSAQRYANAKLGGAKQAHMSGFYGETGSRQITVLSGRGGVRVLTVNKADGRVTNVSRPMGKAAAGAIARDEAGFRAGSPSAAKLGGKGGGIVTRHGNLRGTVTSPRAHEGRIVFVDHTAKPAISRVVQADPSDGKPSQR